MDKLQSQHVENLYDNKHNNTYANYVDINNTKTNISTSILEINPFTYISALSQNRGQTNFTIAFKNVTDYFRF
jgi:hypothetical protein